MYIYNYNLGVRGTIEVHGVHGQRPSPSPMSIMACMYLGTSALDKIAFCATNRQYAKYRHS